jgi:hypothetical protein
VTELEGIRCFSFPWMQSAFANPTLALLEDFLVLGVDPNELSHSLQSFKTGGTLEKSPIFAPALSAYRAANEVFGYADSKVIFERGFPMLRQVIVFGAAVVPGASAIIDGSKLPETESIAKHLQPIVYNQTRIPEGISSNRSGPITMNQAVFLGAALGAWFLKPTLAGNRPPSFPLVLTKFALQVGLQSCVFKKTIAMKSSPGSSPPPHF